MGLCISVVSQQDADLCALAQAELCTWTDPQFRCVPNDPRPECQTRPDEPHPREIFTNQPQQCAFNCPDGTPFIFTVAGGIFPDVTQLAANLQAFTYACNQAANNRVCLSTLTPVRTCSNANYVGSISSPSANLPITFTIIGELPDGLLMTQNESTAFFSGTVTVPGNYSWTVVATDPLGNTTQKIVTLDVFGVETVALPDGEIGVPYSATLVSAGTPAGTVVWSITAGQLPDGLTLNSSTGEISGTPTTEETQTLTFTVTDGVLACNKSLGIQVAIECAALTMEFTGLSGVIATGDDVTLPSAEYNPGANGYEATNSFDGDPKIAVMSIHWGEAQLFAWIAVATCDPLVSGANSGALTAFNTDIDKALYIPVLDAGISAIDLVAPGGSGATMGDCLVVTTFECPGISDLNSIVWGAPVLNEQGNGVASMSVSGPIFDFDLFNPNDSGDDAGVEVDGTFTCNGVGITGKLTLTVTNYIPHPTMDFPQFSVLINSSDGGSWGLSSAGEAWFTGNGVYEFAVAIGCAPGSLISINILSETVNDGSLDQQTITVNGVFGPWS